MGWWIWIFYLFYYVIKFAVILVVSLVKALVNSRGSTSKKERTVELPSSDGSDLPQKVNRNTGLTISFNAVGLNYRLENLLSVAEQTRAFNFSDEKFLEKYPDGSKVYKYYFNGLSGSLVPEPTNPHDPNAIKVMFGGAHIAYVPADLCLDVLDYLKQGYTPEVIVKGGAYKYVEDGVVYEDEYPFRVHVELS